MPRKEKIWYVSGVNPNPEDEVKIKERTFLIEARKAKKLTQSQLAELIGVTPNCITQYEKNVRFPKHEILGKLCKALEIDINLFFEEE